MYQGTNASNLASIHSKEDDWLTQTIETYTEGDLGNYWIGMKLDRDASDTEGVYLQYETSEHNVSYKITKHYKMSPQIIN